jgi:SAM-dependent methyltransferase
MSDLVKHYQSLFKKYGPSPKAVQYADLETQIARFEILAQIDSNLTSVIDVGCGLGDFWSFLRSKGDQSRYLGLDIVPEFIEHANARFTDDSKAQLINSADVLPTGYNYAILSGVFNNKTDDNWEFMTKTLRSMYVASTKGIAFNAMSKFVDYYDPNLYYVDPMEVLNFCKQELQGHPVLRHDYSVRREGYPFEFAIYVYKKPQYFGSEKQI